MYTLIYNNGAFNRPDTLLPFLEANIGGCTHIQIDCITPYPGTSEMIEKDVCSYLSNISHSIKVIHKKTRNCNTEFNPNGEFVNYLVMDIRVTKIVERESTVK